MTDDRPRRDIGCLIDAAVDAAHVCPAAPVGDPKERLIDQMTGSQQFFSRLTKAETDRDAARAEADELRDMLRVCHQHSDYDDGYSGGRRDERAEHRDDLELLRKQRDELRRERDELKAAVVKSARVPVNDEAEALRAERDAYRDQSDEDHKARGRLVMELDELREQLSALADRWEARADDMTDDARDILLNHARRIRDIIEPDIPLPDQHTCDDYCHSCREPGEA